MTAAEQPVMPKQIARRRRHVTTAGRTTSLAAYYSSHAEAYEARWAAALVPASERLLTRLTLSTASRVLDLRAGVGTLVPSIRRLDRHPGAPRPPLPRLTE